MVDTKFNNMEFNELCPKMRAIFLRHQERIEKKVKHEGLLFEIIIFCIFRFYNDQYQKLSIEYDNTRLLLKNAKSENEENFIHKTFDLLDKKMDKIEKKINNDLKHHLSFR